MSVTTLEGIVRNGQIVLPDGSSLPESARVYVLVPDDQPRSPRIWSPRLADTSKMDELKLEVFQNDDERV